MKRNRIPIIVTKASRLMLVLLGFQFIGCYDNVDNTQQTEVAIELPQIITDAELSGRFEEVDGTLINSDYTLEIGNNTYPSSYGEFYVGLEKVNKINQLITVNVNDEIVSLANIPLLPNELHTITFNPIETIVAHNVTSGSQLISANNLTITFEGEEALTQGVNTISVNKLTDHLGYSGVINNNTRVVLNHIHSILIQSSNTEEIAASVTLDDLPITGNIGVFIFDHSIGNWKLVKQVESSSQSINIPLLGMITVAEYAPCVVYEGDIKGNQQSLVYQRIEVNNPSLSNSYAHYTTYEGKYLAFFEQEGESEITTVGCKSESGESILINSQDSKGQTVYIDDNDYSTMLVRPLVFDCNDMIGKDQYATLCKGIKKVALQNETTNIITTCDDVELSLETLLEDGSRFSLPWEATIQDSIIYLPTCVGFDDGYTYLEINGIAKVLPVFDMVKSEGNTILTAQDNSMQLILRDQEKRTYAVEEVGILMEDEDFGDAGFSANCGSSPLGCGIDYCQVTHADEGWFRVSFGGRVWMQTISPAVAGNFYVKGNILIKE